MQAPLSPSERPHPIPSVAESLNDCGYLFSCFRENLVRTGHVGIVAIHLAHAGLSAEILPKSVALFIRMIGEKLAGKIEGGYRGGAGDFFLLLVPDGHYSEALFRKDMTTIRTELTDNFSLPHMRRRLATFDDSGAVNLTVDGVFLNGCDGEKADNVLFRAFQELFSTSSTPECLNIPEQQEIEEIIRGERITPFFQPIVLLQDDTLYGHEALSRITGSTTIRNTEELFATAASCGLTEPLDMLCRKKALIRARELDLPGRIFLNVCPQLIQATGHERGVTAALLDELQIERSRITFELTERTLISDYDLFLRALSHYREQGYAIAIDDLGSGYAGLKMLARIEPDYVKLARFLIADIDTSSTRQALVEALVTFCARIGAMVIAEGIERREELEFLRSAGVFLGQGYLLGRPAAAPSPYVKRNPSSDVDLSA
jgi:EAL domain-containing protein (putative c-di-GMP-specific phosphodiesterase class I)